MDGFSAGGSSEGEGDGGGSGSGSDFETMVLRSLGGVSGGASSTSSTGNTTVKIDPPPGRGSTAMVPCIRSTTDLHMLRPMACVN